MLLYFLAFVGGVLTIASPCILPVLPFVFSRSDQPFRRSGLPLLAGVGASFAGGAGGGGVGCGRESNWAMDRGCSFCGAGACACVAESCGIFEPAVCQARRA